MVELISAPQPVLQQPRIAVPLGVWEDEVSGHAGWPGVVEVVGRRCLKSKKNILDLGHAVDDKKLVISNLGKRFVMICN